MLSSACNVANKLWKGLSKVYVLWGIMVGYHLGSLIYCLVDTDNVRLFS